MRKTIKRILVAGLLIIGLPLGAVAGSAGTALAASIPGIGSTTACNTGSGVYCLQATVTYVGPASQCGNPDYWSTTDYDSEPISWTYANGSTECTGVSYSNLSLPANTYCNFYLYVPNGDATATLTISAEDNNYHLHSYSINEAPVQGWQYLAAGYNLSGYFFFTDANGQSYPTKIGWGNSVHDGIWASC